MLAQLEETATELASNPPVIPEGELSEAIAFLDWLRDNHFTFLGCRDYVFSPEGDGHLDPLPESGLGLLADPETRVVRRGADRSSLTPEARDFLAFALDHCEIGAALAGAPPRAHGLCRREAIRRARRAQG
jgi:glutamate dehydrogenase